MLKSSKQINFAVKQNLKGIENKKVLITSKLKKNYINIISSTNHI